MKEIVVIGGGFSGLAAASHLARQGFRVRLLEKNESLGGRARSFSDGGFHFDMGPSWYWMPEIFEAYFEEMGSRVSDHYELIRLDPSYRVHFEDGSLDLPAGKERVAESFEALETGASKELLRFLQAAEKKYRIGMGEMVRKPSLSPLEFAKPRVLRELFSLGLFSPLSGHIRKRFHHPWIRKILEFPVLFLGSDARHIPALYSLMNHADIGLGTWYPKGGMKKVIDAMERVAVDLGVEIRTGEAVEGIERGQAGKGPRVRTRKGEYDTDATIASCDGAFADRELLGPENARYSETYWKKRTMAPSVLLFFLGVERRVEGLEHHNLFFDRPFDPHLKSIREESGWPEDPLFYVCAPSRTDATVAPQGMENLFILVPLPPGLKHSEKEAERIYQQVMERLGSRIGISVREHVTVKHTYGPDDLVQDYHAFRGNAYGLANTLRQTAFLKPTMRSRKVPHLYFAGQTTVPGPGVPPSLISGGIAAELARKELSRKM